MPGTPIWSTRNPRPTPLPPPSAPQASNTGLATLPPPSGIVPKQGAPPRTPGPPLPRLGIPIPAALNPIRPEDFRFTPVVPYRSTATTQQAADLFGFQPDSSGTYSNQFIGALRGVLGDDGIERALASGTLTQDRMGRWSISPELMDNLASTTGSDTSRTNRFRAEAGALALLDELSARYPGFAAGFATVSPESVLRAQQIFEDKFDVLVANFGDSILRLPPEMMQAAFAAFSQNKVGLDGKPVLDANGDPIPLSETEAIFVIGDLLQNQRQEREAQQNKADALAIQQESRDRLAAAEEPIFSGQDELADQLRTASQTPVISDELVNMMFQEANRLIQRTYGQETHDALSELGNYGPAGGSFERQLRETQKNRALEARIGALTDLREFQVRTNSANALEYTRLLSVTQNASTAQRLQFQGMLSNLDSGLAALTSAGTLSPTDFSGIAAFLNSLQQDSISNQLLMQQLNPSIWQLIGNIGTNLGSALAYRFAGPIAKFG